MKIFILTILFHFLPAVPPGEITDDIAAAIRAGNTREISKYFSDNVDLKIGDKEDFYSKAQAELILKNFFSKHPPKSFALAHKGPSKSGGGQYAIGNLETSSGKYKVYFVLKKEGNDNHIQQIRFEEEE